MGITKYPFTRDGSWIVVRLGAWAAAFLFFYFAGGMS